MATTCRSDRPVAPFKQEDTAVNQADLTALGITLKLAGLTTLLLLLLGTPLAWWLARTRWRLKFLIEAVVALPLVLPPTVLGFYLLVALGPNGWLGGLAVALGGRPLAFTFTGLVIGSFVYSLPFVVQPLQNAFLAVGRRPLEAAATLGASPRDRFFTVAVPLARPGFLTAAVLGFAHTVGEFGVVLMIGGNIPGKTQVLSIAIYDHVEALEYGQAHTLAAVLLAASFLMLVIVYGVNRRFRLVLP
jgi:molybdate transport system permease protein